MRRRLRLSSSESARLNQHVDQPEQNREHETGQSEYQSIHVFSPCFSRRECRGLWSPPTPCRLPGCSRAGETSGGKPLPSQAGGISNPPPMSGRPDVLHTRRRIRGGSITVPVRSPRRHRRPPDSIRLRRLNQPAHEQNVDQSEHRRHPGNEIEHGSAPAGPVPGRAALSRSASLPTPP